MFEKLVATLLVLSFSSGMFGNFSAEPNEELINFEPLSLIKIHPIPVSKVDAETLSVEAVGAMAMDVNTGVVIYEKNARTPLPMASLTKIMTALLILEDHELDEVVTVEDDFDQYGEVGVKMWLKQNEKITVENLLTGLLVSSAGDAAIALAKHHSDSIQSFVLNMNKKAESLGLLDTSFTNTIGLDHPEHYSSVYDLALLTKHALRNKDFKRLVNLSEITVKSVDGKIDHELATTNFLLNSEFDVRGVKTGTTDAAGQSLITVFYNDREHPIITVMLNSPDRFKETRKMIKWLLKNIIY